MFRSLIEDLSLEMVMHKKIIYIVLFFILPVFGLFANEPSFQIRFYNKEIYNIESEIFVKIQIMNNSPESVILKVADERFSNIKFDVFTLRQEQVTLSELYLKKKNLNSAQPYKYRLVELQPKEEMAFIVRLNDYIDIKEPGIYKIKSSYFYRLDSEPDRNWTSNTLTLSIRPDEKTKDEDEIKEITMQEMKQAKLPPDEVVAYLLTAIQESSWIKFFLYLDLPSIIKQNDYYKRQMESSDHKEQTAFVERYKKELISGMMRDRDNDGKLDKDKAIIDVPFQYEIENTNYNNHNAKVTVKEFFDRVNYIEVKRYTYHLVKEENIWKISEYEVTNIGNVGKKR